MEILKFAGIVAIIIFSATVGLHFIFKERFLKIITNTLAIISFPMLVVGYMVAELGLTSLLYLVPISLPFIVGCIVYYQRGVVKPLNSISKSIVDQLSKGDINITFDSELVNRKDEFGDITRALDSLKSKLNQTIDEIRTVSYTILTTSGEQKSNAQKISQDASEQASSVEEISSTMEQIVANIEQNSQNANETGKISQEAYDSIKRVEASTLQTVEAYHKIADKITVINDIAFQTNILALNAAVEAARAGAEGKGFAVVATEVRKLAEHSKTAADEIVNLVQNTVETTEKTGKTMVLTIPKIENTTRLVQEINNASIEQNNGANQVNNALQQLNNVTQQNAASSEELASSSEELNQLATRLQELLDFFKKDGRDFENIIKQPIINKVTEPKKTVTTIPKTEVKLPPPTPPKTGSGIKLDLNTGANDGDFEKF